MSPQVAAVQPAPAAPAPNFLFTAGKTHVRVEATDRSLGMKELLAVLRRDPKLARCVVEQCGFDGDRFTATLRLEPAQA